VPPNKENAYKFGRPAKLFINHPMVNGEPIKKGWGNTGLIFNTWSQAACFESRNREEEVCKLHILLCSKEQLKKS
jgi:hypothetical protein